MHLQGIRRYKSTENTEIYKASYIMQYFVVMQLDMYFVVVSYTKI